MKKIQISNILEFLEPNNFAIFFGAGISFNSGLPLANEITSSILKSLPIDNDDMDKLLNSKLPFEAFIEVLIEHTNFSKVISVFEKGEPNTNHILIARLAKLGYLKTIVTTNFDLLLEKALEKEGLKENIDFRRYFNEDQFCNIDYKKNRDTINLLKIHGTADNKDSIRTTLKAVASRSLSARRMGIIKYLFSSGEHKKVIVLGYSCSDTFDIIPQILSLENKNKEIFFVEHTNNTISEVIDIKLKNYQNPFKEFPGKIIKTDTNLFIKGIWNHFNHTLGEYKFIVSNLNWLNYVNEWKADLAQTNDIQYFIIGILLRQISNFKEAIKYYEKSLEISNVSQNNVSLMKCHLNLGNAQRSIGKYKEAIENYEASLKIAKEIEYREGESKCYTNIGVTYNFMGDFKKGIKFHENSVKVLKEIGDDRFGESRCYIGLGVAYRNIGNIDKAIEYHEKSLAIAGEIGDKLGEAACYTNIGVVYATLKNYKKAFKYQNKSLKITKDIGDRLSESICYKNLGDVYEGIGDFDKAILFREKALKIKNEIEDKAGKGRCYGNLGNTYRNAGDFSKAIQCYMKAENIFKEIEQFHYLKEIYKNLSDIYYKIHETEKAEKYRLFSIA